jgi:hypothetical protein
MDLISFSLLLYLILDELSFFAFWINKLLHMDLFINWTLLALHS